MLIDYIYINLGKQLRGKLCQHPSEHFVGGVYDTPADEGSGVVDVNAVVHLAQRALTLLVHYATRLPQAIEWSTHCTLHARLDDVNRIENRADKGTNLKRTE